MKEKCNAHARVQLPWGGKILNYCPVHANQIAAVAEAMGSTLRAQTLPASVQMECESQSPLTVEERALNDVWDLAMKI